MDIAPFDPAHHEPHAIIQPEDTQRVLAADPTPRPTGASLKALEAEAMRAPAYAPGQVLVQPGRPLHLLAIIHDLDREPTWRAEWIRNALIASFKAAHRRGLTHVATPLLGAVHGRAAPDAAGDWLIQALSAVGTQRPAELWLLDLGEETVDQLQAKWTAARIEQ